MVADYVRDSTWPYHTLNLLLMLDVQIIHSYFDGYHLGPPSNKTDIS
jgi:hypothetical protein